MKFTTLCALAGATSASEKRDLMSLPVFDSSSFSQMYEQANAALAVNAPGHVTGNQCDDDTGIFHFDLERSDNSEIHKGQDVSIKLRGNTDSKLVIENLHINVAWNGVDLYQEDHGEHREYDDDVAVDLGWYLPAVTPGGSFVCTITGYDENGKSNLCAQASFYLL